MSILRKTGTGRILRVEEWVKQNNDPSITYQYYEGDKDDAIDIYVDDSASRTFIRTLPPVRIRKILNAKSITLFNIDIDSDSIKYFPRLAVNNEQYTLDVSNCKINHNDHVFLKNARFTSCVFNKFILHNPLEMKDYKLDRCVIQKLITCFPITPDIYDSWMNFKGNNTIETIEERQVSD